MRRPLSVLALAIVLLGASAPAAALAQSSPFAPIPQATPAPAPVQTTATSDSGSQNLSEGAQILLFGGGALALTAIIFFIWRDARRRAPLAANETPYDDNSIKTPHPKKRQQRARGKQAKQARRRNRAKR